MKLVDLLFKAELRPLRTDILIALGLCGLANAGVLLIINIATAMDANASGHVRLLLLLIATVCLYNVSIRYATETATLVFERLLHNVRCRLVAKISEAELTVVERLEQGNIYNILVQEIQVISGIKYDLIWNLQACFLILFTLFYIAFLSSAALYIVVALGIIGSLTYWSKQKGALPFFDAAIRSQEDFVDAVNHLLGGFNELKMNRERRADLNHDLFAISALEKKAVVQADTITFQTSIFSRYYFFIVWSSIVFLVPKFFPAESAATSNMVTAVLFIFGPLGNVIAAIPSLMRANLAAERLDDFEHKLDSAYQLSGVGELPLRARAEGFSAISLQNVAFTYVDPENNPLFTVGPLSLTIQAGEIVFVVGGNGSGKSTLMKLLTALYPVDSGEITVDDEVVTPANAQDYRQLFSILLSDFHLFPKLYGIEHVDTDKANRLLKLMQLDGKTQLVDHHFTNLDLSTGQKKRLAMVVVFLEDRPIYVFDEWAADQDPEFRRYYYEVLLRELKAEGKTIIAVSHDDRYFHVADKVIKMDYGKIVDVIT